LLDGYISYTLTPRCTEIYLNLFIKCLENERNSSLVAHDTGWAVVRAATGQQNRVATKSMPGSRCRPRRPSIARGALGSPRRDEVEREVFDHKVNLYLGTIVPQPTWIGVSEKTGMQCPVFFVQRNGTLGVPFQNSPGAGNLLCNAMVPAPALFRRRNQNMRMRIQV